jgi:hypothetical protein
MLRFFSVQKLTPDDRAALEQFAAEDLSVFGPGGITRVAIDEERTEGFLDAAESRGVQMFHDAEFKTPEPKPDCQGNGAFASEIRQKLTDHTLGGNGALITIVDGGFEKGFLNSRKIKVEEMVHTRFVTSEPRSHGNMCAADASFGAPHAAIADLTVRSGDSVRSGDMFEAFLGLLGLEEKIAQYSAWVISISLEMSHPRIDSSLPASVRLTLNQQHPLFFMVSLLSRHGFDVVIAAGNEGCSTEPYITGLATHPQAITVGSVDVNGNAEPLSSRGSTESTKPDIMSYTNMLLSEAYRKGQVDDGTSAATALAAGLIASYRTSAKGRDRVTLPPDDLHKVVTASAKKPLGLGQGHDTTYGWGIF